MMKLEEQKQRNCFVLLLWKILLKKSHENLNYNLVLDNGYRKSSFKYGITHHSSLKNFGAQDDQDTSWVMKLYDPHKYHACVAHKILVMKKRSNNWSCVEE
jgi:hypothetical protein